MTAQTTRARSSWQNAGLFQILVNIFVTGLAGFRPDIKRRINRAKVLLPKIGLILSLALIVVLVPGPGNYRPGRAHERRDKTEHSQRSPTTHHGNTSLFRSTLRSVVINFWRTNERPELTIPTKRNATRKTSRICNQTRNRLNIWRRADAHGLQESPGDRAYIFEDSPTCMNYHCEVNPQPGSDCVLMQLVPPELRFGKIPCRSNSTQCFGGDPGFHLSVWR